MNGLMLATAGAMDVASGDPNASTTRAVGDAILSGYQDDDSDAGGDEGYGGLGVAAASDGSLVQTLPPSSNPPAIRDDGTMRTKYLSAAEQYEWAAGEYEKQGEPEKATEMRHEAAKMREAARSLESNATPVRGS